MDSNISKIYIELLDEGTFVLRPTRGRHIKDMEYVVLPTDNYDPEHELWKFVPGTHVNCEWEGHEGEVILVAKHGTGNE